MIGDFIFEDEIVTQNYISVNFHKYLYHALPYHHQPVPELYRWGEERINQIQIIS